MPNPDPSEPQPLAGLADPNYTIPPWPDGYDENAFREHLDALHARYMGETVQSFRRDRLRTWRDRYAREALDADRMAGRLAFLAELAVDCPTPQDETLRALVIEARRGVPRVHTSEHDPEPPRERPLSENPQHIVANANPWLNPMMASSSEPPRCA